MMRKTWIAAVGLLAATTASAADVLGAKPGYLSSIASGFPNEQAVTPRIWIPGLDDGWTPQGLAIVGTYAIVSAYQDHAKDAPKCRVFRVELATGKVDGSFDMPDPCRHAGGVTGIGNGRVVLAGTRQDWRIDLDKALANAKAEGATRGMIKLAKGYGSAFTFFDGKDLWNGVFVKENEASEAKVYRLDLALFDRAEPATVSFDTPLQVVQIPALALGAAFDRDGTLWIAASEGKTVSWLYRFDVKSGKVLARYGMPPRIENISFDASGRLWAISESWSRKYANGAHDFPFIFEIDVAKLK